MFEPLKACQFLKKAKFPLAWRLNIIPWLQTALLLAAFSHTSYFRLKFHIISDYFFSSPVSFISSNLQVSKYHRVDLHSVSHPRVKLSNKTLMTYEKQAQVQWNSLFGPTFSLSPSPSRSLRIHSFLNKTSLKTSLSLKQEIYCHPSYLNFMQSTSWEMLDWMKHKLESRKMGEVLTTTDRQMTPHLFQKVKKN